MSPRVESSPGQELESRLYREALARAGDSGGDDEDDSVRAARELVEAAVQRLAAAEAQRARYEESMRTRAHSISLRIAESQAAAMGAPSTEAPSTTNVAEALDLGCARIVSCLETEECLEVCFDIEGTRLGASLARDSLALANAHVAHDVVDVADLLDAAGRETPPNDLRLVIRELRARLRQLKERTLLYKSLVDRGDANKVHANDDYTRLSVVNRTFTAVFTLPDRYPDHTPEDAVVLESLSLGRLTTQVDAARARYLEALKLGATIDDIIDSLQKQFGGAEEQAAHPRNAAAAEDSRASEVEHEN